MTTECDGTAGEPRSAEELLTQAEALCSSRGQRFTPLRRQIFSVIARASGPMTAYRILDEVQDTGRESGPPTIYRALDFLQAQHLIHRVESLNAFVACQHPERHHTCQLLICTGCGTTSELEAGGMMSTIARTAARVGFTISETVLEFKGLCVRCRIALASLASGNEAATRG